MAWHSKSSIAAKYGNTPFFDKLKRLASLREFFRLGIKRDGFRAPEEFTSVIPSLEGNAIMEMLKSLESSLSEPADISYVLFMLFAHEELFVDIEKTDPAPLVSALDRSIREGLIKFPWIFDHLLYDRAFNLFPDKPDHLSAVQTELLLKETPAGVFQLDTLVSGPGGLWEVEQSRLMKPLRELLLWHCSDATCNAAHTGFLMQSDSKYGAAVSSIRKVLDNKSPESEWLGAVYHAMRPQVWTDDFAPSDLPLLLGNSLSHREVKVVLRALLDNGNKDLRKRLFKLRPDILKDTTGITLDGLTKAEVMQMLLLSNDASLVAALDRSIARRNICVPPSELRTVVAAPRYRSWAMNSCELSDLGLRVAESGYPRPLADPMARLKRLILEVYGADDDRVTLSFYLRGVPGSDVPSQLEHYLKGVDPSTAIKRMLFTSPDKLKKAFDLIRAPHFEIPADSAEDEGLIARILWKLAFHKERVESRLAEFYSRLDDFKKTARDANVEKEDGRSLVRSVGVNLFVSLEEILDLTLSFLTWLFLSDPSSDALKFNLQKGRTLAASALNGTVEIGGDPLQLDDSGRNTLFPLMVGLTALARRIREVIQDPTSQEKPAVLLAHYATTSTLQLYPYRHYCFACDVPFAELTAALTLISEVASALQSEPVLHVRNRLDHKSENFPLERFQSSYTLQSKEQLSC